MDALVLKDFVAADADWVIARHAALYAAEEGYDATFAVLVADIVAGFLHRHDPACENGWIAARGTTRLGSIFVVRETNLIAKLRLVLLEPEARGTGLAQHMLATAMGFARNSGYTTMRLWTHESHTAAGRLYARAGFRLISSTPAHAFGQNVVDQIWECVL
jgi:GNAT superfamily N-acetyltransferase